MAGTIAVGCPKCGKVIHAPEVLRGKKIRCKACETTLLVGGNAPVAAKSAPPAKSPAAKADDEWSKPSAYGLIKDSDKPRCPFCANDLEENQAICLKCGYNLLTRERMATRVLQPVTPLDYTLWLLPGMACVLVVCACIGGIVMTWTSMPDFSAIYMRWTQADEATGGWRWGAVYATVMYGFILWYAGVFAVKRLILHPHPPEVEKVGKDEPDE